MYSTSQVKEFEGWPTCTILMVAGAKGRRTSTYFCKSTPPLMATRGTFT